MENYQRIRKTARNKEKKTSRRYSSPSYVALRDRSCEDIKRQSIEGNEIYEILLSDYMITNNKVIRDPRTRYSYSGNNNSEIYSDKKYFNSNGLISDLSEESSDKIKSNKQNKLHNNDTLGLKGKYDIIRKRCKKLVFYGSTFIILIIFIIFLKLIATYIYNWYYMDNYILESLGYCPKISERLLFLLPMCYIIDKIPRIDLKAWIYNLIYMFFLVIIIVLCIRKLIRYIINIKHQRHNDKIICYRLASIAKDLLLSQANSPDPAIPVVYLMDKTFQIFDRDNNIIITGKNARKLWFDVRNLLLRDSSIREKKLS